MKTKTIKGTLHPVYKEWICQEAIFNKDNDALNDMVLVKVFDADFAAFDDPLGEISLDWSTCVDNPGMWAIDDIFPL
jgi:Ca2+-dependent lipid-binding protein